MNTSLYSVRMRASFQGQHLAGAERIVPKSAVREVVAALTERAMNCPVGSADEVHCSLELVDPTTVCYESLPDVSTCQVSDWQEGRQVARELLARAGVQDDVAVQAIQSLAEGAGPDNQVMRGAVIMDAKTGVRLETDPSRGVRVSRMDVSPECRIELEAELTAAGLGHHRVLEALVLAGKVLGAAGLVAELCWSDDPNYTAGYVAEPRHGYQRIPELKEAGDAFGGRVFFVDIAQFSLELFVDYLESQVVLFDALGSINSPGKWIAADE